jgi:U3 small nucleolar RNA-associated protein 19
LYCISVDCDPFLDKEEDPMKTNAVESSLWEVKSLQSHLLPSIAIAARFIDEKIPTVEWDLADVLEGSYQQVSITYCTHNIIIKGKDR